MAKVEQVARVALAFNEAFNRQDVEGIRKLLSDDCVLEASHPAPDGALFTGKQAVAAYWQEAFSRRPGARRRMEDLVSLGERCLLRWKLTWDAPAGGQAHVRGIDLFRVTDGAIREILSYVKG